MMNINRRWRNIVAGLVLALPLSGCIAMGRSPVRNHQKDYLKANSAPTLQVPADVTLNGVKDTYPLPTAKRKFTCQPSLIPPGNPGAAK